MLIPEPFVEVVKRIHDLLSGFECPWAFTGSLDMAIQGMQVEVHDVDIQTDREGAYLIQDRLEAHVVREVRFSEAARIRSHFGEFRIGDAKVEVMGDVETRLPDGVWQGPPDLGQIVLHVRFAGLLVPVIDLEHEKDAYRVLGRTETVGRIEAFLRGLRGAPGGVA